MYFRNSPSNNRLQHKSFNVKELSCADVYIWLHLYADVTALGGHHLGIKRYVFERIFLYTAI